MILSLILASGAALFLYKYIVSRQRLAYDRKINTELLGLGLIVALVFRFLLLGANMMIQYSGIPIPIDIVDGQAIISAVYTVVFTIATYRIIDVKVIKPQHYINRYDIVIYTLCVAIGHSISNLVWVSVFGDGITTLVFVFSSIIIPLTYMMVMGTFLIRFVEGRKLARLWSIIVPSLIIYLDAQLYISGTLWGVLSSLVFEILMLGLFMLLFLRAIRSNVQIDGIDVEEQLDRFENEKTIRERISYKFDLFMSNGKLAMTGILILAGVFVIVMVTVILLIETPEITEGSLSKTLWLSFMRVLDPGNVATDPDFKNGKFVVVTTIATLLGTGIMATFIGIISGDFSARIEKLREGNSKVLEKNHILFLGFCEDTLSIIDNIIKFQDPRKKLSFVILSELSRQEIEDQIDGYGLNTNRNKIICRSGNLESKNTLLNMGIARASHVVIVGDKKEDTARVAMTVNNILKANRHKHIDIQLMADSKEDLHLVRNVFGNRMTVFSRQELEFDPVIRAGALKEYLKLYGVLVGVDGDLVISITQSKRSAGKSFGSLVNAFKYSSLIGVECKGQIELNPNKGLIITEEHKLILLCSSNLAPDYVKPDKKFILDNVKHANKRRFVKESAKDILVIGDRNAEEFTTEMLSVNPNINLSKMEMVYTNSFFTELDQTMATSKPDIVVLLGSKIGSDHENDELSLKILAYLDAKYNRKKENYVVSALLHSVQDIKFAYELDYIDLAIENDKCRRMALDILDEDNLIIQVEEKLFEAGDRVGAVLAAGIVGTSEKSVSEVYRDCLENDLILIGYIVREGGIINVEINPNKNDKVTFDDDDLLLVID